MKKVWKLKQPEGPDLLSTLLSNRGAVTVQEGEQFLNARYEDSHDPFLLTDMDKAVGRIRQAMAAGEKITIYADYDADAVTAAAVLLRFFRKFGHENLSYYIPDRYSEGYGMNLEAIKFLANSGTKLLITVDCGINAFDAVDLATYLGLDVIITDHHQLTGGVPRAQAVVNPHRPDDAYPFRDLTGVGVAFKLVQALVKKLNPPGRTELKIIDGWEKWLLDLVAIGTVADCQTLLGENRIFVKWGLKVMQKTQWPGLRKLLQLAGIWGTALDTYKIGFVIAPRINAAGRIEHANQALELLFSDDSEQTAGLAQKLEDLNRHRQDLTQQILSEAREQLVASGDKKVLLAAGEGWPKGIVGLVAGKLTEEFYRPVLVLERGPSEATGSARSIGNFNIIEAIGQSKEILVKYGGHPMAAGFTLLSEHITLFHQQLLDHAERVLTEEDLQPVLFYEAELKAEEVTPSLVETLEKFAPFGQGNSRPRFRLNDLSIKSARPIGAAGKHLRLEIESRNGTVGCIGFNQGFWAAKLSSSVHMDIICEPQFNEWNGTKSVQLKIIDLEVRNGSREA
jgi:single-stranded-DNA-specific exonuclease